MSFEDDRHCDSLSGSALGTKASPGTLRGAVFQDNRVVKLGRWLLASGALVAACFVAVMQRGSTQSPPELRLVDDHTLSYSEAFAAHAGIRTVEVREAAFTPVVLVAGNVSFDPEQVAVLNASALGTVRQVSKYEGDNVKRGEVLAELCSPSQARREARGLLQRHELPQHSLGTSLLRSPLDGTVVERRIVTGQAVRGESAAFVVANLDRLAIRVNVDEQRARGITVGDRVEISRDPALGSVGIGTVTDVAAGASEESGSELRIRIGVDNRARRVRAGELVSARIFVSHAGRALLVPNRALTWIGGQPTLFVAASSHSASIAAVTLGRGDGEQTEVRGGLTSGQRVVSDGVLMLKDASFL